MRGARRSLWGPGVSARISSWPPTPSNGSTLTASTTIPIPPYHWVSWRHSSRPRPWESMSVSTVEPEAVKPEIDSNSAESHCDQPKTSASSTYGRPPRTEHHSQVHTTTGNTSAGRTSSGGRNPAKRITPTAAVIRAAPSSGISPLEPVERHSTRAARPIPGTRNRRANPTTCTERFSRRRARDTSESSVTPRRARLTPMSCAHWVARRAPAGGESPR